MNKKYVVAVLVAGLSMGSGAWFWETAGDKNTSGGVSQSGGITEMAISNSPLPADEAFAYSATFKKPNMLIANWNINRENYLYRNKFFVDVKGAEFGDIEWPKGKLKDDPLYGDVYIHKGNLAVELPLKNIIGDEVELTVKYQGCWVGGVCYPPMEKVTKIKVSK